MLTALIDVFLRSALALSSKRSVGFRQFRLSAFVVATFLSFAIAFNQSIVLTKLSCSGMSEIEYVQMNLVGSEINLDESLSKKSWWISKLIPTIHYLNHEEWNYAQLSAAESKGGPILFAFVPTYLGRIGLPVDPPDNNRVYSRGGTSLPRAAFHDFGWTGIVLIAMTVATTWSLGVTLVLRGEGTLWLGLIVLVRTTSSITMSYLFVAPATISFPFTLFAFAVCALAAMWDRSPRSC